MNKLHFLTCRESCTIKKAERRRIDALNCAVEDS